MKEKKQPKEERSATRTSTSASQTTQTSSWKRPTSSRRYNGPTGTPEYPYHTPELDAAFRTKRFPALRKSISILLSTLAALFLICVITGAIVVTALTVYVMNFKDDISNVTIEEMELSYNTNIFAYDAEGNLKMLYEVSNAAERVPVSIDEIPQHVRDAFVYVEDERFYTHDGVDYKRTVSAFANMFIHIYDTDQGGSTITQQLVKNLTGDNEQSPSRKIREIFRAMELERTYSKDEILETYLNYIGFGGATNGIQLASQKYFGKDVSELDVAEAACLAAIPKSPNKYNPFASYEDEATGQMVNTGKADNRKRQQYVLWQMYDNGAITYDEYQQALNETLIFTDSDAYKALHPDAEAEETPDPTAATSWVVDAAINEFASYLQNLYNLSYDQAVSRINRGGYQIYVTVDLDMQAYVEERYKDLNNLVDASSLAVTTDQDTDQDGVPDTVYPQSAFIALNYDGSVRCVVGAIGEKTESLCWDYAIDEPRQPGSTIKPLTTYGLALESNLIQWGSVYEDAPIKINGEDWPTNYSEDSSAMVYSRKNVFVYQALAKSYNTVPAQLCQALTPQAVFDFATQKMGLNLLDQDENGFTDIDYSPLTVGALSYGITLENLVNGYIPYGNGGTYAKAHIISKVEQGNHELIYENNGDPKKAIDSETAYVMNKLLQNVVNNGTGTAAQLSNKHVAGKTGTTEDWNDLTFVGLTEDFVSGVWIGYTPRQEIPNHGIKSAQIWQNIIGEYANSLQTDATYPACDTVIEDYTCAESGKIAGPNCKKGPIGYWKSSNAPKCDNCQAKPKTTTPAETEPAETKVTTAAPQEEQPTTPAPTEPPVTQAPAPTEPPAEN